MAVKYSIFFEFILYFCSLSPVVHLAGDSRKSADVSSNVSHQSTPHFPKPNVDWKNSDNLNSKANPLKARIQTPYHPGPVRKQNAAESVKSSLSKPPSDVAQCQAKPTQKAQKSFYNETAGQFPFLHLFQPFCIK